MRKIIFSLLCLLFAQSISAQTRELNIFSYGEEAGENGVEGKFIINDASGNILLTQNGDFIENAIIRENGTCVSAELIVDGENVSIYFDLTGKKILINKAGKQKSIKCTEEIFLNSTCLFIALENIVPAGQGQKRGFKLFNVFNSRIVSMSFTRRENSLIEINGNQVLAAECVMKLTGLGAIFWPYEYRYWFDIEDFSFLKYSGPGNDKKIDIVEIVK